MIERLAEVEKKVEMTYRSVEKIRKYFLWTLIITLIFIVLPLLFIPFAISSFMHSYSSALSL